MDRPGRENYRTALPRENGQNVVVQSHNGASEILPRANKSSGGVGRFLYKHKFHIGIIFVILIVALTPSYYFYKKYQKSVNNGSSQIGNEESKEVIRQVGSIVLLPADEAPVIATITDITKFNDNVFFSEAQNEDIFLVYSKTKKVILYRPSIRKIINISPLNTASDAATGPNTGQ